MPNKKTSGRKPRRIQYISKGQRRNVAKSTRKAMRREFKNSSAGQYHQLMVKLRKERAPLR